MNIKILATYILSIIIAANAGAQGDSLNHHKVLLDKQGKIISWMQPQANAYSRFLQQRWNFIKTSAPASPAPMQAYPQYYFYCAYVIKGDSLKPDTWMNDIGERIPNWFESARLYYAFTGDAAVMEIVTKLVDYTLQHGISPADFAWPNFPYTTTNAGDTAFRGFTSAKRFVLHETQVDHAGDMGLTYYRMYQYTGDDKYKTAAINIANTLAAKARTGDATHSIWPYRVVMNTGEIKAEYGANWMGCYALLDNLVQANIGNVPAYKTAMHKAKDFMLNFPLKTGYWTDGHTDTDINSSTYKSNMSASNFKLYLFDHPAFDTAWETDMPRLIAWTEDNFIKRCVPGEPPSQWGANIVGEQDSFLYKMDYQTARYGAECARWYAVTGDEAYKEKAYRSLNWVTYCSDENGLATESPVSKGINSWWSDCYGEGPRMFYSAMAAMPEWAPQDEDHILYSEAVLKNIFYAKNTIKYTTASRNCAVYLKLTFKPAKITFGGNYPSLHDDINKDSYGLIPLADGSYAVTIKTAAQRDVIISAF